MRSSSNYKKSFKNSKSKKRLTKITKKAQFFVLTGLVIVGMFYLVSRWLEPYTIIDTSQVAMREEIAIFNNIKEEALRIVEDSKSCKDLADNLEEYKYYVEDYAFKKLLIYFDYSLETPCYEYEPGFPILVLFNIELTSPRITIRDQFFGFWPPGSEPS